MPLSTSLRRASLGLLTACLAIVSLPVLHAEHEGKIQIVLLGDSTTEGSIPRIHQKEGPHLEQTVQLMLARNKDLPPCNVINLGQGGDFLRRLLDAGRYDKQVKPLPGVDYIFIRFGLNDLVKRENFAENFPKDFRELIGRLRQDHPKAVLIPTTVIPYFDAEKDAGINQLIRQVAAEEKLPLFDLHPLYEAVLKKEGWNTLNYRRYPVEKVPADYAEIIKPFIHGKPPRVEVMDNRLDAILGHLPGWYDDRHPGLGGYTVIGAETARYMTLMLKSRVTQ